MLLKESFSDSVGKLGSKENRLLRGDERTHYRHEPPISQQTQATLDAVAGVGQPITDFQAVPAEVREIKQILQKQEGRWALFIRSLLQFINLINSLQNPCCS
jgi:hypothetical protein